MTFFVMMSRTMRALRIAGSMWTFLWCGDCELAGVAIVRCEGLRRSDAVGDGCDAEVCEARGRATVRRMRAQRSHFARVPVTTSPHVSSNKSRMTA